MEQSPRTMCTSFPSLEKYADWRYRIDPEPYQHDSNIRFNLDPFPELTAWAQQYLTGSTEPSSRRTSRRGTPGTKSSGSRFACSRGPSPSRVHKNLTESARLEENPWCYTDQAEPENNMGTITRPPRILRRTIQPRRKHCGRRIRNIRRHQWRNWIRAKLQMVVRIPVAILRN